MNRLLIISRCHEPRGGADQIIADLCRHLPDHGWQPRLALTAGKTFNRPENYKSVYPDLDIVAVNGELGTRRQRLQSLRRVIQHERPDIVLGMRVFDLFEAIASIKSSREQPLRFALGIRAFEPGYLQDLINFGSVVDYCMTSGELIAQSCVAVGRFPENRVISIPGGVPTPSAPRRTPASDDHIRLLYAGRLEQAQKRVLDLCGITDQLQRQAIPFRLSICGSGPAEEELRSRLEPLVQSGQVQFHGWCDKQTLYDQHLPAADCFIHTAAFEGVTIAPREAMAHGVVPVISQFRGLATEGQFRHGHNCLTFPVGDLSDATAAIARLYHDRALWKRLSDAAVLSQGGKYSFDGAIKAWADAFSHCLELPVRTGSIPKQTETPPGRLTQLGLSEGMQHWIRSLAGIAVQHTDPGSEWPTNSQSATDAFARRLTDFAEACDATANEQSQSEVQSNSSSMLEAR